MTINTRAILCIAILALTPTLAPARTIEITDEECVRMAAISADAPRLSWATYEISPGVYSTQYTIPLTQNRSFLICYPLDRIPKGQRIVKAEWVVPISSLEGEQRLMIRRLVTDWGPGVCHEFRMVRPKKEEWAKPGARDTASDAKTTAILKLSSGVKEQTVNVTEDVEAWHTGAALNHGWIVGTELDGAPINVLSPVSDYPRGRGAWKLRITYEPE
jgi:hypothetical protein